MRTNQKSYITIARKSDFDGLLYVSETRAAEPIDRSLVLPTP